MMTLRCRSAQWGRSSRVCLARHSLTRTARDQQEYVPAKIEIIATGRQSSAYDFSSIVDIVRFY
jgi:hypothetical protein